jgi:linoleoyl-CoA desaturase
MKKKGKVKFKKAHYQQDFYNILRDRVEGYFTDNNISESGNLKMYFKSFVLIGGYLSILSLLYFSNLSTVNYISLSVLMGIALAGIGMSVMHDANHGSYSKYNVVNVLMGYTLNLVGGAVHNWKLQHNILHHTYTNIHEMDDDIEDKLVLKFSPHGETKWYHKFQIIYVFLFYSILTLYWALLKDLVQFIKYKKQGVDSLKGTKRSWMFVRISVSKIFYFSYSLIVPIFVLNVSAYNVIMGFLLMHITAGLILSVVFQLAHTVEGTTHPLPENGIIENDWAIHQLNTTVNFSRDNVFLTWYLGGLNYQVEHHLFPRVCHVHYPEISKIVQSTCDEFNVPYLESKTFSNAFKSHLRLLGYLGKPKVE